MSNLDIVFQIVIASIMSGFMEDDWTELAQMAEVSSPQTV